MDTEARVSIELVEIREDVVFRVQVRLSEGAKVADALSKAVAEGDAPQAWLDAQDIGIFSRLVNRYEPLKHGDRVEIYHPLQLDPMMARRKRSERRG